MSLHGLEGVGGGDGFQGVGGVRGVGEAKNYIHGGYVAYVEVIPQ